MKRLTVALASLFSYMAVASGGSLFVAPDGTGDGSSWANACSLSSALTSVASGDVLKLKQGFYAIANTAYNQYAFGFTLRGGYDGTEADDAAPSGDKTTTVISGDPNYTDYWVHYDPERPDDGELIALDANSQPIPVVNSSTGRINPPPAYTAKYDVYYPGHKNANGTPNNQLTDNAKMFLKFTAGDAAIENLTFTGVGQGSKGGNTDYLVGFTGTGVAKLKDVDIVGVSPYSCAINHNNGSSYLDIDGCRFRFCRWCGHNNSSLVYDQAAKYSRTASTGVNQCSQVKDTLFESCFRGISGASYGYQRATLGFAKGGIVDTVIFRRNVFDNSRAQEGNTDSAVALYVTGNHTLVKDTRFEQCYGATKYRATKPLAQDARIVTAVNNISLLGTRFIENKVVISDDTTVDIVAAALFQAQTVKLYASGCSFVSNRLSVASTSAQTMSASVVLSRAASDNAYVFGDTSFFDNVADVTAPAVCAKYVGNLFSYKQKQETTKYTTLNMVHCAVMGSSATPDIAYYGDVKPKYAAYVANSIFWSSAPGYRPVDYQCVAADYLALQNCVVKNGGESELFADMPCVNVASDDPMLVYDAASGQLKPTVPVAGLTSPFTVFRVDPVAANSLAEEGQYGATNVYGWTYVNNRFVKVSGPYNGNPDTYDAAKYPPAPDALGVTRPLGAAMNGPVEVALPTSGGNVLVAKAEPYLGGTVSKGAQFVADGSGVTVTATPIEGYRCTGWKDENGDTVGSDATLNLASLSGYTRVYAQFKPDVAAKVIFDLGAHATFDGTGLSTAEIEQDPDTDFPSVPAYTVASGYFANGWQPVLPAKVQQGENTYALQYLVGEQVVYLSADATGDGSGRDWANACTNLADAMTAAQAAARTEIRVKQGVYAQTAAVVPVQGVTLRGGFTGEGATHAADPTLTVFDGGNAKVRFLDGQYASGVRGFSMEGVTVKNFKNTDTTASILYLGGDFTGPLSFVGCRFENCACGDSTGNGNMVFSSGATVSNCVFAGCKAAVVHTQAPVLARWTDNPMRFHGTLVTNCTAGASQSFGFHLSANTAATVSDCDFIGNTHDSGGGGYTQVGALFGSDCYLSVTRCRFIDNVMKNLHGVLGKNHAGLVCLSCSISDSLFLRNRLSLRDGIESGAPDADTGVAPLMLHGGAKAVNCSFVENTIAGGVVSASAVTDLDGCSTLVNCSFVGNRAVPRAGDGRAGATVCVMDWGLGLVNCTFADNEAATADVYADGSRCVNLFDCLLWGKDDGYVSVAGASAASKVISSTLKDLGVGVSWSVSRGLSETDPCFKSKLLWSADGLHAYRITSTSRSACRGEDAYVDGQGRYLASKNGTVDGQWYVLNETGTTSADVGTLTHFAFDQIGAVRPEGQVIRGAVQERVQPGLMMIVR